ncbi:MAG: glycosyltransferase family 1 protein, partial [Alphaproteobacteria bacterium]|nr:glycosyltransferase family 1 protein [Alphaproteobacteria bacterium]
DRVGSGADLVHPGENGVIFRTDDVDDLTRVLRGLLKDPQHLATMGQRSLQIIGRWSFAEDVAGLRKALAAVVPAWSGGDRG